MGVGRFIQAQLADADADIVFVQQSHHDGLTVAGGDHADAQVEFFVAGGQFDPAVLGAASFGDVQFGQDFDAAEQGAQQPAGGLSRSTSTPSMRYRIRMRSSNGSI